MPPSDLTRFDFHVVRFMNSYDVEIMTDAEIGQYLLLLCKSWLLAHDVTLPDDVEYLSRVARTTKISARVLAKFPLVETEQYGRVRRNAALFEEWEKASERSNIARDRVARRSDRGGTVVLTAVKPGYDLPGYPNQPIPTRTNPNQPSTSEEALSTQEQRPVGGDWKALALRHKRYFGSKAAVGFRAKYADACSKYGEAVVLECFDAWAPGAKDWVEANNVAQPLNLFFKKLPDEAEDTIGLAAAEKEQTVAAAEEKRKANVALATSVEQQNKEILKQWDPKRKQELQQNESLEDFLGEK